MEAPAAAAVVPATSQAGRSQVMIFRKYYTDNDYFVSPEGILKILSAMMCVVSSVVFVSGGGGGCWGAGAAALAGGAAAALLYAGVLLDLPLHAPQAWLVTDIVVTTATGALLLVTGVLSVTVCAGNTSLAYIHGPVAIVNACMMTASAVIMYASAMRLWDAAAPATEPPRDPPPEQDA